MRQHLPRGNLRAPATASWTTLETARGRTRPLALLVPLALAGGLLAAPPSAAHPRPSSYVLPGDTIPGGAVFPEGITATRGTFYVSSTTDGTIFRGDVRRGTTEVFVEGPDDRSRTAIGLEVTRRGDRLVVAGGGTGTVSVYDTRTEDLVARYSNGLTAPSTFLNDVAFDREGNAYITDSRNPVLYRLSAEQVRSGGGSPERFVDFTGTAFEYLPAPNFNANGIAIPRNGDFAIVVQSSTGRLFRVDLDSKQVTQVDLGGATVTNGDGLELRGRTLYVVRNSNEVITEIRLNGRGTAGRVVDETTDESLAFPTTAVFAQGRLLLVNSQFDRRGENVTPDLPFTVSSLRVS